MVAIEHVHGLKHHPAAGRGRPSRLFVAKLEACGRDGSQDWPASVPGRWRAPQWKGLGLIGPKEGGRLFSGTTFRR